MNYSIYAESTPNPAVMKFVSNRILVSENLEILSPEDARQMPIASAIFNFPFVKGLFISGNFIAITKNASAKWDDIAMQLRVFITDFLNKEGLEIIEEKMVKEAEQKIEKQVVNFSEMEKKIAAILEEYIRPAVESDGGFISLKSFKDGVVSVVLKGACSGCPSSSLTLKQGIEGLLTQRFPNQIKEVVAYEE
ncbi:MAG: NifU family protein [Bacteroidota bacterium]|nr:NifU family protein [Bacteroidota bacterium]